MQTYAIRQKWEFVDAVKIKGYELEKARLQLQQALQLVAEVDSALGLREKDEGNYCEWLPEMRALAGVIVPGKQSFRVALSFPKFSLLITDSAGMVLRSFPLDGKTPLEGLAWLKSQINDLGSDAAKLAGESLSVPAVHTTGEATFSFSDPSTFEEVARLYANAWHCLSFAVDKVGDTSPVRVASATMAMSVTTKVKDSSIVIGFKPQDASCEEFYFYVKPSPAPNILPEKMGELEGGGRWTAEPWFGALMPASDWVFYNAEPMQADAVNMFLDSALDGLLEQLQSKPSVTT